MGVPLRLPKCDPCLYRNSDKIFEKEDPFVYDTIEKNTPPTCCNLNIYAKGSLKGNFQIENAIHGLKRCGLFPLRPEDVDQLKLHPSKVHAPATAPSISVTVATSKSGITERSNCDSNTAIASPIVTSEKTNGSDTDGVAIPAPRSLSTNLSSRLTVNQQTAFFDRK
ncbi:hypothetical protein DPMN_176283 [Dreissena polymorpha]|uniref:Uncharacterized protein n=1 Tax=Dreissena polymorpha TaxID=45954 RepID=A0A9D4IJ13_DREPO|nr:hypothetical protein DPMN_176283 [Dreissena polymorpha]